MATEKQRQAAKKNIKKAQHGVHKLEDRVEEKSAV